MTLRTRGWIGLLAVAAVGACVEPEARTGPEILWQAPGIVWARPLLADSLVIAGFEDGRVTAFNRVSGRQRWTRKYLGPFQGEALVLWGERVLVPEFDLHAVDRTTGGHLWTYHGIDGRAGIRAPAVSGDTVFVADYGGGAAALDVATGVPYWNVTFGEAAFGPTLAGDLMLVGTRGFLGGPGVGPLGAGNLIALDRATGAERWRFPLPDPDGFPGRGGASNSGLALADRVIVGTKDGRVYAIALADGELLWERATGHPTSAFYTLEPVEFAGAVVQIRSDNRLEAFNAADGTDIWTTDLGGLDGTVPVRCGPHLCIGYGRLWVVGAGGAILWAHGGGSSGTTYFTPPEVDDGGRVFIGAVRNDQDGYLRALRLPPPLDLNP